MCAYYPTSKVELSGFTAKHYDRLMDIVTLGRYSSLMQKAVRLMEIKSDNRIIDLGTGTGKNACLMMRHLSTKGELIGLDISKEMTAKFKRRCAGVVNAKIINQRIDKSLPYENEFDKAFISFALHGFPQDPEIISFAGGLPNPKSFPIEDLEGVIQDVLRHHGKTALQYDTTQGLIELRKAIAERAYKRW